MYKVSNECKKAINHYSRELYSKAYIDNKEIYAADIISYEMNEGLISGSDFELGGAAASTLEIKINNQHGAYDNLELNGKEIRLLTGILLENKTIEYIPMGVFIIDEVVKGESIISIEATDKMVTLEKYYESKLTFPTSVLKIANEICSISGLTLATKQFYNSNYIVKSLPTGITSRDVLHDIAAIAGGFAKINRIGKLEIITPATTVATEINKDRYIDLQIKEGFYVDKLTIVENYFPVNPVPINLNILPFTSKWQGDLSLDCGDKVRLNNGKGTYETIITKQKITFNGGLRYESECTGLSDQQKHTQQISNTEKTDKRYRSEIKQLADEIALKVSSGDFEAYQQITDKKIESKVTAITGDITSLQNRVDTAEQKITPTAITSTISSSINNGSSISTTKFVMDKKGLTIKNGGLTIKNNYGDTVFSSDTSGNLKLTGHLNTCTFRGKNMVYIEDDGILSCDGTTYIRHLKVLETHPGWGSGVTGSFSCATTANFDKEVRTKGEFWARNNSGDYLGVIRRSAGGSGKIQIDRMRVINQSSKNYMEIVGYQSNHVFGVDLWSSDIALKENIVSIEDDSNTELLNDDIPKTGLDLINNLNHYAFDYKESFGGGHVTCGYVAQELQELNDNLVMKIEQQDGTTLLQPKASNIIPNLSLAIKQQQKMIEDLKKEIEELKSKIRA